MEDNIHKAKTSLTKLRDIGSLWGQKGTSPGAGKPVAKLVPVNPSPKNRVLGSAKGEFTVPDDFNDPLPKEIEDLFW